jgi:hypothetical protein
MNELNLHTPTIIRQAASADAEALSALRLEALQRHPQAFGSNYSLRDFKRNGTPCQLRRPFI